MGVKLRNAAIEHRLPGRHATQERAFSPARLTDLPGLLLVLLPALYVAVANAPNTYDDAFITYRYAYNLAGGQGFVYNPGEWFLGTTAPLYGLLLGLFGLLAGPDTIPLISGWLSGLALLLAGIALFVYGRLHGRPFCGALAGLLFVSSPLLPATFGGEMLFQVALILWAFVLYRLDRAIAAALLLAAASLTRADGVLAALVIGAHFLATRRRVPWRELLAGALALLPFAAAAWIFYGSPLPGTLDAKLAQRDSGLWPLFLHGAVEWIKGYTMQGSSLIYPRLPAAPNAIRMIYLVALGVPALLLFRFWLLPISWVALYLLGYHLLNVPFYHWYIVPAVVGLSVLAACAVAGLVDQAGRLLNQGAQRAMPRLAGRVSLVLPALAVLALLPGILAQLRDVQRLALQPDPVEELYTAAGHWLAANTPPGASVGYFEVGHLGYYARRPIIDPLGIVNPGFAPHVARRELTWAYERFRPAYIVQNPQSFAEYIGRVAQEPWFKQEYRPVAQIAQPGAPTLTIYRRATVP